MNENKKIQVGVIISANSEWRAAKSTLSPEKIGLCPYGEYFYHGDLVFLRGGCGKVDAAASAQYLISKWGPSIVFNLGTCGGIAGEVSRGDLILVEKTIIYDMYEKMSDPDQFIREYSTDIDLCWLETCPLPVTRETMLSADRDLDQSDIPHLKSKYGAKVVDWESGSIARVCQKNNVKCLIIRGVSDTVSLEKPQSYQKNTDDYHTGAKDIIPKLIHSLPEWIPKLSHCNRDDHQNRV
ncbi:MAG: 5'-methylthioadenosine/S-adenosylhomocysteine nucleosidase [Bacteriovoracaceae bacterium]|jgi:adenosylhomocysteine nucleosidase|nr:5'-methylthioadenosine/S-adenosylhomocysteine nucleosidase [Bacteriovoracaceae bacterium]